MEFIPPLTSHKNFVYTSVCSFIYSLNGLLWKAHCPQTILMICFAILCRHVFWTLLLERKLPGGRCTSDWSASHKTWLPWTLFVVYPASISYFFLFPNRIPCCLRMGRSHPGRSQWRSHIITHSIPSSFFPPSLPTVLLLFFQLLNKH